MFGPLAAALRRAELSLELGHALGHGWIALQLLRRWRRHRDGRVRCTQLGKNLSADVRVADRLHGDAGDGKLGHASATHIEEATLRLELRQHHAVVRAAERIARRERRRRRCGGQPDCKRPLHGCLGAKDEPLLTLRLVQTLGLVLSVLKLMKESPWNVCAAEMNLGSVLWQLCVTVPACATQ